MDRHERAKDFEELHGIAEPNGMIAALDRYMLAKEELDAALEQLTIAVLAAEKKLAALGSSARKPGA